MSFTERERKREKIKKEFLKSYGRWRCLFDDHDDDDDDEWWILDEKFHHISHAHTPPPSQSEREREK